MELQTENIKTYLAAYKEQHNKKERCKSLISEYKEDIKRADENMALVRELFVKKAVKYKDEEFKVVQRTRKAFVVNQALVPETKTAVVTFTLQNFAYLQQLINDGIIPESDVVEEIRPLTTKECQKLFDDGTLSPDVGGYQDVPEVAITLPKY